MSFWEEWVNRRKSELKTVKVVKVLDIQCVRNMNIFVHENGLTRTRELNMVFPFGERILYRSKRCFVTCL